MVIVSGISITKTKAYRLQLYLGWTLLIAAMEAMSTLKADSGTSMSIGIPSMVDVGAGFLYQAIYYPVLAPLPISKNAHAMAFFSPCRVFTGVWGVKIRTAVLHTQLTSRLPTVFLKQFLQGVATAYRTISVISTLSEQLQTEVRIAFADSITLIWRVMIGIADVGFLASFAMKGLSLHTQVDERWGLEEGRKSGDLQEMESRIQET
ncbi:uncharacterized protein PHACADRAFT_198357 [Phanerochaete carnosa HHB-10118-sp]|uniref:Uncharacterized protein n=1 Tax=Phanerochaete carnosa (strain HHB-10118-sp) TaxID=650164 RepID=K5VZR2_PHACS|nr:uncharacterized protein PHACADRAFT_198357 [Phanerochaete carnosa HHB-10118-sp]EKM52290.1 hypothetical protein PHACADRAFT_198357 [Phanerochaete carnosa HHB-10118-sp]